MPSKRGTGRSQGCTSSNTGCGNTDSERENRDSDRQAAVPAHSGKLHEGRAKGATSKIGKEEQVSKRELAQNLERLQRELQWKEDAHRKEIASLHARLDGSERQLREELQYRLEGPPSFQPYLRKMTRWASVPVDYTKKQTPDRTIKWLWELIGREIEFISQRAFAPPAPWDSLAPALREKLARLTPKAQQYMEDENWDSMILYEAWIWRILVDTLFPDEEPAKGPWVGEHSEHWAAYAHLQRFAAPHLATSDEADDEDTSWTVRYRIWRNLTVGIIRHVTGDKTRISPDVVAKALKDEIDPLYCTDRSDHGMTRERLHERIELIARSAVQMDTCMQLDRGDWAVVSRHPDTGALFGFPLEVAQRPDGFQMVTAGTFGMTTPPALAGRNVHLIVVPQLRMRGDYYGCTDHLPMVQKYPMRVMADSPGWSTTVENGGDGTVG